MEKSAAATYDEPALDEVRPEAIVSKGLQGSKLV